METFVARSGVIGTSLMGVALLMIPSWSSWNVGEDLALGAAFSHVVALASVVAGLMFLLAAIAVALSRPAA